MEQGWMVQKSEIEGLNPAQIKDKLALKYEPTHIVDVTVKEGATIERSTANGIMRNKGGATQFYVEDYSNQAIFSNPRPLEP